MESLGYWALAAVVVAAGYWIKKNVAGFWRDFNQIQAHGEMDIDQA